MKNSKLVLATLLFSGIIMFGCKKDYECSCRDTVGAHKHFEIKEKKNDADAACKALAVGTYTFCEIE